MPYEQPTGGPPAATGTQPATEQATRPQTPGRASATEPTATPTTIGAAMKHRMPVNPRPLLDRDPHPLLACLALVLLVASILTAVGVW